jgi:hypothetical protein
LLGSEGAAKRQRERHAEDRKAHKDALRKGKAKEVANVTDEVKAVC